jgi:hypothetical protein
MKMADDFNNSIQRSITMVKGDTLSFGFQVSGLEGQEPDEIYFTCKEFIEDSEPVFQLSLGDGIEKRSYDAETDTLTYGVRVAPELTQDVELGKYFYDLELDINNDVLTLMKGSLSIEWEVKS